MKSISNIGKFTKSSLKASVLFERQPPHWGLRGDPFLWREMKVHFRIIPMPDSEKELMRRFEETFKELTGHALNIDKDLHVERYSHGGMSSGFINSRFWRTKIMRLLKNRLAEINRFPIDRKLPTLKILTWNCHQKSFEQYLAYCEEYSADIMVIQECLKPPEGTPSCIWLGKNPSKKGLAVFSRNGCKLSAYHLEPTLPSYYLPVAIEGPVRFNLVAVWSQSSAPRYIQGAHKVIDSIQESFLDQYSSDMVMIGDFNSNSIWDQANGKLNHTAFVKRLEEKHGMASTYHHFFREEHGKESIPTHLWRYSQPFHIDYCFAPLEWCERIVSVKVGGFDVWRERSDHAPLVTEFAWFPWQMEDLGAAGF